MKHIKIVFIVLVLLIVNDLLLLKFTGFFDEGPGSTTVKTPVTQSPPTLNQTQDPEAPASQNKSIAQMDSGQKHTSPLNQESFTTVFSEYAKTPAFTQILDEHTFASGQRMIEMHRQISGKSAQELYDLVQSSTNTAQRQLALQALSDGKLYQLTSLQLKEIYRSSSNDFYGKYQVLQPLLEKGDAEAIEWTKEAILNDPSFALYGGYQLVSLLYEKDKEFLENYARDIRLEDIQSSTYQISAFFQESDLQKIFLQNNFDQVLESKNSSLFEQFGYGVVLELSHQQQRELVEMLLSEQRSKRQFAANLIGSVQDANLIRDSFYQIQNQNERRLIASSLTTNAATPELKSLAKELIENSLISE